MITTFTIKKAIDKRSGFVLPLVVVFLGSFFTMATIFYLFNLNQRPVVDILDRSAFADYIASGMAEILKLKVKEFPEEFRDTMKLIEFMQKQNQNPGKNMCKALRFRSRRMKGICCPRAFDSAFA